MIVDDDPDNLRTLKDFFENERLGWNISTAKNEEEFKDIFNKFNPDVIISDLVMAKNQGGIDVLRHAKEKDPLVMVILVTAYEKKLDRYSAFDLGAFDCIQKNMPGVKAVEEILVKTKAALYLRELVLKQIENEKQLTLLRRYFDPRVFKTVQDNPDLLNLCSKTLTICFWDIRGFSLLCEILKAYPQFISSFLQDYFRAAAKVIFEHHGILDKFIGDCAMGLFGALLQNDDKEQQGAINAVKASIEMNLQFKKILEEWMPEWVLITPQTIDLGLGCGIHTGEALVGNVGTEIRDQYTALGPNVNFAQRLESHAKKDQILISATTEVRVKNNFVLKYIKTIDAVKNIPGKFKIFEVQIPF